MCLSIFSRMNILIFVMKKLFKVKSEYKIILFSNSWYNSVFVIVDTHATLHIYKVIKFLEFVL